MAAYKVAVKRSAAKEIEAIGDKKIRRAVVRRIQALAADPRPRGCEKLSGLRERYRVRQGPYRILYAIEDQQLVVYVVKVAHRREAYR